MTPLVRRSLRENGRPTSRCGEAHDWPMASGVLAIAAAGRMIVEVAGRGLMSNDTSPSGGEAQALFSQTAALGSSTRKVNDSVR